MTRFRIHLPYIAIAVLWVLAAVHVASAREKEYSRPVEIRGVWMDRNSIPKTEQGIRDLIRTYAKAGINLVHPEVIFNGYSSHPSSYLTQMDLYPGIDMLGILIDEAHKHKIEVHPWVWIFRAGHVNDKGGILSRYPEWAALNRDGTALTDNGSYWLCPSIPAVRRLVMGALRELAEKYPVDGIELDYIRFASQARDDHCYNESCRTKFKAAHGIDPVNIRPFTKPVIDWQLWREELVNSFVREASEGLKKIRPNLLVSAAVASYPDKARLEMLQDWEHWATNKWVDFLSPMDYTPRAEDFTKRVGSSAEIIANRSILAPGIGVYTQQGTEPMLEQIEIARNLAVGGVTFFATHYLGPDRVEALRTGPFNRKAELPLRSPVQSAAKLIAFTRENLAADESPESSARAVSELETARNLIEYASYMSQDVGYVPPTKPDIFIPETVVPIPEVTVPRIDSAPELEGKLDDEAWSRAAKITLDYNKFGCEASQPTDVYLAYDDENLYIAYRCHEPRIDRITAEIIERDGPVFYDDSIEFFLAPHDSIFDYYQVAINSLGISYDARVWETTFNPQMEIATSKAEDHWVVEVAIPFVELNVETPAAGDEWRANFTRNRAVKVKGPDAENMCWSPTYGSFHTPIRFGVLSFGD